MRTVLPLVGLFLLAGCSTSAPTADLTGAEADAKKTGCPVQAWYTDADGDGRGYGLDVIFSASCKVPGRVIVRGDCDDADASVNRGALEICDGIDNDCDGAIDSDDAPIFGDSSLNYYADADGDTYGNADDRIRACEAPTNYVSDDTDCDDADASINPGALDNTADGVDNDCDTFIDEDAPTTLTITDLTAGSLVITEVMQNPSEVGDSAGEWFEVRNDAGGDVDLDGLEIGDDPTGSSPDSVTVSGSLVVADGDYVVFGVNDDTATNGGITVDYDYGTTSDLTLGNSGDELILSVSGTTIDEIAWDNGTTFPDPTGASMSLDPASDNATDNDNGANWCEGSSVINSIDLGTPGAANDACPTYLWQDIYDTVFDVECFSCHTGGGASGGLDLDDPANIIEVPSDDVPSMNLIEPGDLTNSYLWHKLQGTQADVGGTGQQMPRGAAPMDSALLDMVQTWIEEGAPE